ncbi:MAG: hypothetical protein HC911_09420 [Chloroflexaceae bacterium]|nr:hypothetical protein [Chloroflexaceae bacterium]
MISLDWHYNAATMSWTSEIMAIRAVVTTNAERDTYYAQIEPEAGTPIGMAPHAFTSPEEAQQWCAEIITLRFFPEPDADPQW